MRACPACGEENSDRARFCQSCATPLAAAEAPAGEIRKVVTVVFADVSGSTALGERLDPEALRRVMSRYFDRMDEVIRSHGGTVEKFIGDAVMAVFGIPRLHEDDPIRAVRAAAGMLEALEELNAELEREHGVRIAIRIGVNTGEVVAGDATSGQRLVTGDTVNVAARLEQAASPGDVLLGETTARLVKDAVEVEPLAPLDLRGKSEGVAAFRLLDVRAGVEGHERHLDSPLVGRDKELELLGRSLDRAVTERTSHLFTLLGPAGVGKSRLVREFLTGPMTADATVLRGRCLSYGDGVTFYPLGEVVHAAASIDDADPPSEALRKLEVLLKDAPDGARVASLIGGLFGWSEPGSSHDGFWAVRKLFEELASEQPVVVVFDDIHWAEPTFLDLIDHLADWTRDASLVLLCIARPELLEIRGDWGGGKMNATSILLEPLSNDAASDLLDNLLGRAEMPPAARARILEAADGNPLFVEEMLAMLIDDGLLRFEDGTWRAIEDLADLTVPPTIHLLLAARLDRLDAEERAVIERGAIEGKVFHTGAVATLAPEAIRPNVPSRLLALARKELIRPDRAEFAGEDAFRFRHLLIRDAAYQAMPKQQRADLHEAFAEWLERAAGERVAEYEDIIGYHLERAFGYRSELGSTDEGARAVGFAAAERLLRAGERAVVRGDVGAAAGLLERAAAIARPAARARASLELARLRTRTADFERALSAAEVAIEAARAAGDRATELKARLVAVEARAQRDPTMTIEDTRRAAEEIAPQLEALGDDVGVIQARLAAARSLYYLGQAQACLDLGSSLFDVASSLPIHDREEMVIQTIAASYFGPTPADEGLDLISRGAALLPDTPLQLARFHHARVAPLAMLGHEEESRAAGRESDRLWDELGDPMLTMLTQQGRGEAERFLGHPEVAERHFRSGMEALDAIGETGFNSTMSAVLAFALCDLGRHDEAEPLVEKCRSMTPEDDVASQAAWRIGAARIALARDDAATALRLAEEAVDIMSRTDYIAWQAEFREILADAASAVGDDARAARELELALSLYERKRVVRWAARVRERLGSLR